MIRSLLPLIAAAAMALGSCQMQPADASTPQPGGPRRPVAEGGMCGGIAGFQCRAGLTCQMDAGQCRVADASGVCRKVPQICTMEYNPVCGCDGKTYGNACNARAAGVSVEKKGEC